jgi:hypothetical protein
VGKRYVFWRTPKGTPRKGSDDKHAPTALLAKIGESASINDNGKIRWGSLSFLTLRTAVRLSVVVVDSYGNELNDNDAWPIVHSALISIIKQDKGGRPVAPGKLIAEADKQAAKHFRKRPVPYVLVSSLTIDSFPCKRVRVGGCDVAPLKTRKRYPEPTSLSMQRRKRGDATSGQLVRVKTVGRTIHEATEHALRALDLLRGLWTLFATFGSWSIGFGDRSRKPIGIIHVGRTHTLHKPDGAPIDDIYWYDSHYPEECPTFKPKRGWKELEKARRWALSRLNRLAYRDALEDLIVRYSRALDHVNHDVSFLHMWSLLEKLTDTVGADYGKTIQRTVWMSEEKDIESQLLAALRSQRNQYVHAGMSGKNRDQIAYLIKRFVDVHLVRLLRNDFDVKGLEEYAAYLDLPSNIETLRKKHRQLARALRMQQPPAAKRDRTSKRRTSTE